MTRKSTLAIVSGARLRVRDKVPEHAAADGEVILQIDDLRDIAAAQVAVDQHFRQEAL